MAEGMETPRMQASPVITPGHIKVMMGQSHFEVVKMGEKTTVVCCKLPNGFVIVEAASCVNPDNYDQGLGETICRKRIEDRLWELEGYRLQNDWHMGR